MTLQQQALKVIEGLPDEKLSQVIQFAEFLSFNARPDSTVERSPINEQGYLRKPGILKRKMVMADDFDETPDCFEEYM
ncbi:MAG: DUF2281 domain-containing protein [Roseburia sp.]|nr:DUF2281 domain-containing protein [Roseburia sp.]